MGDTRLDCPYDSEVWGVNNGYRQVMQAHGRMDKLFICHRDQEFDWQGDPIFDWDEQQQILDQGVQIISLFQLKHVKGIKRLPIRAMMKKFDTQYFSDSIAYMVAYAIHINTRKDKKTGLLKLKEPMRLRFYGADMHTKDEYATERGGIEYFIAWAKALGVDVWIHPDSSVCKTNTGQPYGYFKINYKKIDPNNVLKLQKTPNGINRLINLKLVTPEEGAVMRLALEESHAKSKAS